MLSAWLLKIHETITHNYFLCTDIHTCVCVILADIAVFFHNLIKQKGHEGIYLKFPLVSLVYLLLKYNNKNR